MRVRGIFSYLLGKKVAYIHFHVPSTVKLGEGGLPKMIRGRSDTSLSNIMLCSMYAEPAQRALGSPGLGGTPAQGWAR